MVQRQPCLCVRVEMQCPWGQWRWSATGWPALIPAAAAVPGGVCVLPWKREWVAECAADGDADGDADG